MTVCPIALLVGCRKCPVFSICPLKGAIGDYRKAAEPQVQPGAGKKPEGAKPAEPSAGATKGTP